MAEEQLAAHKVTKPIQLLAAWLVGMTVIDGIFISGALALENGSWERGLLVVAAIFNVPLFLIALFVLQTRFRAELQEDPFYFEYISRKTDTVINLNKVDIQESKIEVLRERLETIAPAISLPASSELNWARWPIALNEHHKDFKAIKSSLHEAGIPVTAIFGQGAGAPERWAIAISKGIPTPLVIALLRVLVKFEFEAFEFWQPIREANENEDVYIGSYGAGSAIKITEELRLLLDGNLDHIDFEYYISCNSR